MCVLLSILSNSIAQQNGTRKYALVGDTIADHTLTDIVNFDSKTAKLSDYRGKWLILDFWGPGCTACFESFPKMDTLAKQFKDKVQIFAVGINSQQRTKQIFEKLKQRSKIEFACAFDSILAKKYDVFTVPHIMVIDGQGILRAKVFKIDSAEISQMISGKMPDLSDYYAFSASESRGSENYNRKLPLLTNGKISNGGMDTGYLFRSMLCKWSPGMPGMYEYINFNKGTGYDITSGRVEFFKQPLEKLFLQAFFGISWWDIDDTAYYKKYYPHIVIRTKDRDSIMYRSNSTIRYCYSLQIPKERSTSLELMNFMQNDLEKYFGYRAKVEKKQVPVYYITVVDKTKLNKIISKSPKGTKPNMKEPSIGKTIYSNYPFKSFLQRNFGAQEPVLPFFDLTGFDQNIDLTFTGTRAAGDITRELMKLGLNMEPGTKEMTVLVLEKQ